MDRQKKDEAHPAGNPWPTGLGQEIGTFPIRHRTLKRWSGLIAGLLFFIIAAVLIMLNFFSTLASVEIHGRAIILSRLPTLIILLFGALPFAVLMIVLTYIQWNDGITCYKYGMVQLKFNKPYIKYWKDITQLDTRIVNINFSGSTFATRMKVCLKIHQEQTLIIRNKYDQMEGLINQIRLHTLPVIYEKTLRMLNQGKKIDFNKHFRAILTGLEIPTGFIAWHDLNKPVIIKNGLLLQSKTDPDIVHKSKIQKVNNLDLFLHLIENPPDIIA